MSPVRAGTGGLGERLLEGQQGQGVTDITSSTFCEKKKKRMEIFQAGLLFMAQDQAAAPGGGCPALLHREGSCRRFVPNVWKLLMR